MTRIIVKTSSITSSDVSTPKAFGAETPFSAIPQIQLEPRVSRSETALHVRLVRMVPGSARNWIAVNAVQQSSFNFKNHEGRKQ
jgi:hypothetical protein